MLCVCCLKEKDTSQYRIHSTGHRMRYCVDCHLEKRRTQYAKKQEHRTELVRKRYAENKNGLRDKCRKANKNRYQVYGRLPIIQWTKDNPEKAAEAARNKMARHRKRLSDYYINRLLTQHDGLPPKKCPKQLIECKRLQIQIERLSNEKREAA